MKSFSPVTLYFLIVSIAVMSGCVTTSYRDSVIRNDAAGEVFHNKQIKRSIGVFVGTLSDEKDRYYHYQFKDIVWGDGTSVIELIVPFSSKGKATMRRIYGPILKGGVAYFHFQKKPDYEHIDPYIYRMSPADLLVKSGKVPYTTKMYDASNQNLFPTDYPAMVSMRLTEDGPGSKFIIGRQVKQSEIPVVKKSDLGQWDYDRRFEPEGLSGQNKLEIKWWSVWSEEYQVDSYLFPTSLSVKRAVLTPGYLVAFAVDIAILPITLPFYLLMRHWGDGAT